MERIVYFPANLWIVKCFALTPFPQTPEKTSSTHFHFEPLILCFPRGQRAGAMLEWPAFLFRQHNFKLCFASFPLGYLINNEPVLQSKMLRYLTMGLPGCCHLFDCFFHLLRIPRTGHPFLHGHTNSPCRRFSILRQGDFCNLYLHGFRSADGGFLLYALGRRGTVGKG